MVAAMLRGGNGHLGDCAYSSNRCYVKRLFDRFDVDTRAELVLRLYDLGYIDVGPTVRLEPQP
jgi:hypothetical protein